MRVHRRFIGAGAISAMLVIGLLPGAALAKDHTAGPKVVATGLANPRGITIGRDGKIYVAESGRGGSKLVSAVIEGQAQFACLGKTGAVTRIDKKGHKDRIAKLPSFAAAYDPDGPGGVAATCPTTGPNAVGTAAVGPTNLSLSGKGTIAVTMGLGGNESVRDAIGPTFGTLLRVKENGKHKILADLVGWEQDHNPDGEVPDSNPYGTTRLSDGSRLVADAGGNDLLRIRPNGSIETVAVFPHRAPTAFALPSCLTASPPGFPPPGTMIPAQAVTTSVAVGPDGAWYVGLLTGFPFTRNTADVFRVDPVTHAITNFTGGIDLSYITGLDFGPDGSLYVVEFTQARLLDAEVCGDMTPGAVWKIKAGVKTKVADAPLPTDVAVAANGSVYVTVFSILPRGGEVWKIQ
jgi:hypothetical protein